MQAFAACTQWTTVHQFVATRVVCIQMEKLHTEVQRVQWIAKPISRSLCTNIHIIAV